MSSSINTGSVQQPSSSSLTFPVLDPAQTQFTFESSPPSSMGLSFPLRPSPARDRNKRSRPLNDVDGEHSCLRKKKRRLRLVLITSRLSKPYSYPATNIVDRGNSKIAVWAKHKALARNLLRKAAILNSIRKAFRAREAHRGLWERSLDDGEKKQRQWELAKLAYLYGSLNSYSRPGVREVLEEDTQAEGASSQNPQENIEAIKQVPTYRSPNEAYSYTPSQAQLTRKPHLPLPPSPLGLSNYDAFDLEDDIPDRYADLDEEDHVEDEETCELFPTSSNSTSASSGSALSTATTGSIETVRSPPQEIYSDFNILDPGQPVLGDYDDVDVADGWDTVWPGVSSAVPEALQQPTTLLPVPTAPAPEPSAWATSPNFCSWIPPTPQPLPAPPDALQSAGPSSNVPPFNIAGDKSKKKQRDQKKLMSFHFNS